MLSSLACVLLLLLGSAWADPTGTSGTTTFPMGSGTCDFYITGSNMHLTPAPAITLDSDTISGTDTFGFDPGKSDTTKWHIVSYPAPADTSKNKHDIHIMWFPNGTQGPPKHTVLTNAITYEQATPQWTAVSPLTGISGDSVHIDGTQFDSSKTYYAQFGPQTRGRANATVNSTAATGFSVVVPDLKSSGQVTVKVYEENTNASTLIPFNGTNPNAKYFTYTDTCPDSLNGTGIDVGAGRIQTLRQSDTRYPVSTNDCGCGKTDIVNPIPVNNDKFAVTSALGTPYRVHSWASGMLWADNTTPWYNPYALPTGGTARQTPVYADPLIACYTNDNGTNYFQQSATPNTADNEQSVYAKGFHLGMPNPAMDSAATYNSGTDNTGYNQDAAVSNGQTTGIQVGLSQMGVWRDTLVVYPTNGTLDPTAEPRYLPAAAKVHRQGDFDIEFVMDGTGFDASNPNTGEYLKLGMAQGSPFAQFTTYGTPGVMVAGVFPRETGSTDSSHGISATGQYSVSGGGNLNYVVLHQQVNSIGYAATGVGRNFTNWVSFALLWDPTTATLTTQNGTDGRSYLHLAFTNTSTQNRFVVAGLPNQMSNTAGVAYDATLADNWVNNIAAYAFNYFTDSKISYAVGKKAEGGTSIQANHVNVAYTPTLESVGPSTQGKTVFLLQPLHYSESFEDGRTRPLNGEHTFLTATGTVWADPLKTKYWISRGRLEAMAAESFDCTYVFPGLLPYFPFFDASATRTNAAGKSYNLGEMAAAMIAQQYYLSEEEGTSSPATTSMDLDIPEDSYNVCKTMVRSAKMLPMLLNMQSVNATMLEPDYHIGTPTTGKAFSGHNALVAFTDNLADAFTYYFGKAPRCSNGNKDSYYYSYYDPGTHHLLIYPATGAAGDWPTNLRKSDCTPEIWDGFGTVTMLNDHHYTYGYPILAASLLSMALSNPAMPSEIANQTKLRNWWSRDNWGAIVDQMVMNIAYDPDVTSWYTASNDNLTLTYPKMEFMDQWSGISWTDGFIQNSLTGHNANSPWEHVQSWAGVLLWGQVTERKDVADLGIYLYTLGLYGLEAYRYNTIGNFVPDSLDDYRSDGTFMVKASQDFGPGGSKTDGTLPYFDKQEVTGNTMFDRQMSKTNNGNKTMRVTYIFQSQLRADNTYNQTPIGQQYTSTYPIAPWSLAMTRDHEYMTVWAQAIKQQNGKSLFTANYATNINLLYALLGLDQTVAWTQGSVANPLPVKVDDQLVSTYPDSAFRFTQVSDTSPYDWYWSKCTWSDQPGLPIWQQFAANGTLTDKLSLYISNDKTLPEPLLDFYTFDRYGRPDFSVYATYGDGSLAPQAMAFTRNNVPTYMAYNPTGTAQTITFKNGSGTLKTLNVAAHSLHVSQ
jgi:hypothetical protein